MQVIISDQVIIFLYSIIGGALIALVYDIFRLKRRAIKTIGIFLHIEDLVYWIIVAFIMFAVVFYSNEGELRGYIVLGTFIGVVLYILLLSRLIMNILTTTVKFLINFIKRAFKLVISPIIIIIKILLVPLKIPLKGLNKLFNKFFMKIFMKLFKKSKSAVRSRIAKINIWKKLIKKIRKKHKQ